MKSIEVTGKSVDAAVFSGLQQLGVSIDEVEIETLQTESKGILGIGAKPAKVRLTVKAPEDVIIPDFEAERRTYRRERGDERGYADKRAGRRGGDRSDRRGSRSSSDRNNYDRNSSGRNISRSASDTVSEPENSSSAETDKKTKTSPDFEAAQTPYTDNHAKAPEALSGAESGLNSKPSEDGQTNQCLRDTESKEPFAPAEKVDYTEEAAENNPAAEFVSGLVSRMGIEAKILAYTDEKSVKLRIDSESMGVLIGHRGETLDAIQYLTSLVANKDRRLNGYRRVTVNTNDYREKREETLIRLAKRVGEQVRVTGRARTLEPMNPYERRILHSVLQPNPYVTTHSEGEEPNRRVIVTPVKHR